MFRRNLSSLHNLLLVAALVTVSVFPGGDGNARPCSCTRRRACRVVGPSNPVRVGDQFAVTIQVEGAANLGAFEFEFGANPSIASTTVADIHLGEILGSTGRTTGELRLASSPTAPGRPLYAAYSYGAPAGPSGNGQLATITMLATGQGTSSLDLVQAQSHRRVGRGSICKQHQWRRAGSRQHSPAVSSPDSTRNILVERSAKHSKQIELLRSPVGVVDVGENQAGGLCQGG